MNTVEEEELDAGSARRSVGWTWAVAASFFAACAASGFLAFVPVSDGNTALNANPDALRLVVYPVCITFVALLFHKRRTPRLFALGMLAPIGILIFSIGFVYLPSIALMAIAAAAPAKVGE